MIQDTYWMNQALNLAEQGRPWTSPNPLVGAVIVKNNRLISKGYHSRFGAPHAEVEAIQKAGRRSDGATLYVTLEPCSTFGKTPPCTELVKRSNIKRLVVGALDPNPVHAGRGISFLKKNKICVTTGILEKQVLHQNESFVKWVTQKIPFVILKMAQSLDGKIASRTGSSRWISGPEAREWVHDLRSQVDAILIGKNTLLQDNPRLTVRNAKPLTLTLSPKRGEGSPPAGQAGVRGGKPWRVVLDPKAEVQISARIFRQKGPILLVCLDSYMKQAVKKFNLRQVTLLPMKAKKGRFDLLKLLQFLGSIGIASVLVEGGGELAASLIEQKLVDKIAWIVAPKMVGGRDAKTSVEGMGVRSLSDAPELTSVLMKQLGNDFLIEGYLASPCFLES